MFLEPLLKKNKIGYIYIIKKQKRVAKNIYIIWLFIYLFNTKSVSNQLPRQNGKNCIENSTLMVAFRTINNRNVLTNQQSTLWYKCIQRQDKQIQYG